MASGYLTSERDLTGEEGKMVDITDPITTRLMQKKKDLERQLAEVNDALSLMNENPGVSKVLNAVGKVIHW